MFGWRVQSCITRAAPVWSYNDGETKCGVLCLVVCVVYPELRAKSKVRRKRIVKKRQEALDWNELLGC